MTKRKTHRTRLCTRCNEWFITTTKTGKVCDNCNLNINKQKRRRLELKATNRDGLPKWYILRNGKVYEKCRSLSFAKEYTKKLEVEFAVDKWEIAEIHS